MENVYDLIAEFYDNDENWEFVLEKELVEGFLRKQAWKGADDQELKKQWNKLLMLCLYLGNGDIYLDEMDTEKIIDMIAWCGRNVNDFTISPLSVIDFLDTLGDFFTYMEKKNMIVSNIAPYVAKTILITEDGSLAVIDKNGNFLPGQESRAYASSPDGDSKIFLSVGDSMMELLNELQSFFRQKTFDSDLERAIFFYQGFKVAPDDGIDANSDEYWQTFWDFFMFDYHLLKDDRTPLEHYAQQKISKHQALVEELCRSHLSVFKVVSVEEGAYLCSDFFTGAEYMLNLPISPDMEMDFNNTLIMGHVFENMTMIMNYIRCFKLQTVGQKRLYEYLDNFYHWYKLQEPEGDRAGFISRHPVLFRRALYSAVHCLPFFSFPYETKIKAYTPPDTAGKFDGVIDYLEQILIPRNFSYHDAVLLENMWLDVKPKLEKPEESSDRLWAAALLMNYVQLNKAYTFSLESIAAVGGNVTTTDVLTKANLIKAALELEEYDPRYCNEEGFITMLLNEGNF